MGLSSNILWHQTNKSGFYAILKSRQLLYSYSMETICSNGVAHQEAFPMISLSDLPFSELDFYLNCERYGDNAKFKTYGGYIIGFRRQWGIDNKFSPVWYCETYNEGLAHIVDAWQAGPSELLYYLIGNIKNTEGELAQFGADCYRFQNEREYRRILEHGNATTMKLKEYREYCDAHNKSSLVEPRCGVSFEYSDILYIIVPDDEACKEFLSMSEKERPHVPVFTREEVNHNFIGIRHHRIKPMAADKQVPCEKVKEEPVGIDTFNIGTISSLLTAPDGFKNFAESFSSLTALPEAIKASTDLAESMKKLTSNFDWIRDLYARLTPSLPFSDINIKDDEKDTPPNPGL